MTPNELILAGGLAVQTVAVLYLLWRLGDDAELTELRAFKKRHDDIRERAKDKKRASRADAK
jgi:hypothetical protein